MPRQRPRRVEHLDQPLERQLLVAIGRKVAAPHPPDQLAEARLPRGIGAQHQRVDEEPDQVVQRRIGAPRDRAADRDVGAGPKPTQQSGQSRLQHHEQAGAGLPRQARQTTVQIGPDVERHMAAAVARHRGPRPVGRQLDLIRQVLQRVGPERQLARQCARAVILIAQRRLLPQRVVGVLHRQRRQSRRNALTPRPVQRRQVPRQRTERPAVARDVVQYDQQNVLVTRMLFIGKLEQMRPQRDLARQIEAPPGRSRQRRRKPGRVDRANLKPRPRRQRRQNLLPRHPEPVREQGPQALVPLDQVAQRCFQRDAVERPLQPHRQRDHIGAADPLQTLQEPQPPLRIGQRDLGRPRHRHERRPHRHCLRRQPRRQRLDARRLEQAADRHLDVQRRPDPADQTRRQQRMPAALEEVVVDADPLDAQHLGKQRTQDRLLRRPRRTMRMR